MNVWSMTNWKKTYHADMVGIRAGLRLRIDADVDPDVRRACIEFARWLRKQYEFPMRIPVYVKSSYRVRAMDGDMVCGTFFGPYSLMVEPYARIATGDYTELLAEMGKDAALACILHSMAHELTHYFQWLNQLKLTEIGEERQAEKCAREIIGDYIASREYLS